MLTTRRRIFLCIVVAIVLYTQFPTSLTPTVVDLGYARYQGARNKSTGTTTFYGLKYAAPPTGQMRWQPPVPIEQVDFYKDNPLINAERPGNICHQSKPTWQKFNSGRHDESGPKPEKRSASQEATSRQSEDCLQLDVIVPTKPASASLPVVVFIHGGGFVKGYAAQYDGSNFVSFSRGSVVWVQIHYRLGLFGFLGGSHIKTSGTSNAGLLDQQLALRWVQNHIARFGGDPKRVTIWGGSAGGASVMSQMVLHSGNTEPPFRAAIAEYPWWQPHHPVEVLDLQYEDLLTVTECSDLACLKELSESALLVGQQGVYDRGWEAKRYGYGDFYLGPAVDGKVIPRLPHSSLESGDFAKVPMIVDHAGFEGFIFTNKYISQHFVIQTYLERLWPEATSKFFEVLLKIYKDEEFEGKYFDDPIFNYFTSLDPLVENNPAFYRAQTIFSDATINCPTRSIASTLTKTGQNVWKMDFNAGTQLHATVTKDFLLSAQTSHMTAQMRSYFLAFITSLDPNGPSRKSRPTWLPYSSDNAVLLINETGISSTSDRDAGDRCDFFATHHEQIGN